MLNDVRKIKFFEEFNITVEDAKRNGDYWETKAPSSMSRMNVELNEIIGEYLISTNEERAKIHSEISNELAWSLLAFAENMATYSLRFEEQEIFNNGLFALGLTFGVLDTREILLIMSLYYDVSQKTKLSLDNVLKQNNSFSVFVSDFLNREEEKKSLKCMGYILTKDENGNLLYQRTW